MKIIKEIINYLETELPITKGKYKGNRGSDIVYYNREEEMLTVNFIYDYNGTWKLPALAKQNILDSIDKIVGTKHMYQTIVMFDSGLRVLIQYRYNNINDRITRTSMRTLLGLNK